MAEKASLLLFAVSLQFRATRILRNKMSAAIANDDSRVKVATAIYASLMEVVVVQFCLSI